MIDLTPTCVCKKYNSTLPNMSLPCRRVIPTNHAYNQCCLDHWGAASQDIRTWQSTRSVRIYWPVWPVDEHSLLYTSWEVAYIAQVTSGWRIAVPGGGVLAEKLGRGVRPVSQNPYPIYDQNLRFSLPYLWPNQKFDTLFMTWPLNQYPVSDLPYNYFPSSDQC